MNALVATARTLVASGKGLLAMDESNPTCNKRFAHRRHPTDRGARRAYRPEQTKCPDLTDKGFSRVSENLWTQVAA